MLSRPLDLLRPPSGTDEALLRVSPVAAADLRQLPIGDLQARVTAALPGRIYQVLVGDRAYTVSLPIDARPGDELQLTVVGRDSQRVAVPAPPQPVDAGGAAVTTLSATARFITTLLNTQAPPLPQAPLTGMVRPSVPLIPGPPGDTAVVAARLSHALATSGMFYESHQAQWVAGARSLAQLLQEPQARVAPLAPEYSGVEAADAGTAGAPGSAPTTARTEARAEASVHPALLPIVKEQLQTLSALQLAWQGPVWPGQDMHWEIAEEPGRGSTADTPAAWRTRLRLTLPRLGDVSATLSVSAAGVAVSLTAATTATADTMTAGSAALRAALSRAGSKPASVTIAHGEPR